MASGQQPPGTGYNPKQQGVPTQNTGYPPQNPAYPPQNPGYPSENSGYPPNHGYPPPPKYGDNPGYPPTYPGDNPPAAGFVPHMNPPHGDVPPDSGIPFIPPHPQAGAYATYDAEDPMQDEYKGFDFNDKSIRRGFIRKVYAILMLQLLITVGFIALFLYHAPTRIWFHRNPFVLIILVVVTVVLVIAMSCCSNLRRKAPTNYIFLFLFTAVWGILLGAVAARYDTNAVLMAAGITALVCFALTLFAFQTKLDFTMLRGILGVALIILLVFGIAMIFIRDQKMNLIYASVGALLFSVYLVYDTQLMMGGKHKYSISPEEYIFAALNLYLDVINIFIFILRIMGSGSR